MPITPKMPAAFIAVLLFITVVVSCSKSDPAPTPPIAGPDSTLLSKYIILDTTIVPADTFSIETYEYDNQKRMVKSSMYRKSPTGMQLNYTFEYTYPGTDTLPEKITERWQDAYFNYIITHHTRYDIQGRMVWDSSNKVNLDPPGSTSIKTNSFSYFPGGVRDSGYNYPSGTFGIDSIFQVKDNRNNIIEEYNNPAYRTFAEYDNNVNPFFKVSPVKEPRLKYIVYPNYFGIAAQKNNLTRSGTRNYDASGNEISSTSSTFEFIFNPNGLPTSIKWITPPSTTTQKFKYLLYYTN